MHEALDEVGTSLGRDLQELLERAQVRISADVVRAVTQPRRFSVGGSEVLPFVDETCAVWTLGRVDEGERVGRSVCLGCGVAVTFVLSELVGRPKHCTHCGQWFAKYL